MWLGDAPPVHVLGGASPPRGLPQLGLGNELVWQSVDDSVLAAKVNESGSTIGRYPGGTPSDYWNWQDGWPIDVPGQAVRRATPRDWAAYSALAGNAPAPNGGGGASVLVVNQLTSTLEQALAGLEAHATAGTPVRFVELGNEMYDSSRPDVVAAYPNGTVYAAKMATWAAAIAQAHPGSQIATLAMTWREDNGPREAAWNGQTFGNATALAHVGAASLHPYFGIHWPGDHSSTGSSDRSGNATSACPDL